MSGMEAASAGIALVGFVATTIQQLDKLITTIRNARGDLSRLIGYSNQLRSGLTGAKSLTQRLSGKPDQYGSLQRIEEAVKYCNETFQTLEVRVRNVKGSDDLSNKAKGSDRSSNKVKKTMTSLRYCLSKGEILEIQDQLHKAMMILIMAVSTNGAHRNQDIYDELTSLRQLLPAEPKAILLTGSSQSAPSRLTETVGTPQWAVESYQSVAKAILDNGNKQPLLLESIVADQRSLSLTESSHSTPNRLLEDDQKTLSSIDSSHFASQDGRSYLPSLDAPRSSRTVSKESVTTWYDGYFGTVTILKKSKYAGSSLEIRKVDAKSMSEETALSLRPSFWKKYYELRFLESSGRISRTLNVDRVVDVQDPIFGMCRSGDILGLTGAFCGGRASPDVVDEYGMGLLHHAAGSYQLETCKFLLLKGVDVNRADVWRRKALTHVATRPWYNRARVDTKTMVDIARLLAEKQEDLSAFDISSYFQHYNGPPEAIELILLVYSAQYDNLSQDDDFGQLCYPTLAAALKFYAWEPLIWERILRLLIRKGADLHAPVRRNPEEVRRVWYPCLLSEFGTPLDELFASNKGHEAAKTAADGWLQILLSEGQDLTRYLQNEFQIHAKDMQFTHASICAIGHDIPRRLFFDFGDHAKVFWDWWVDPASSTSLVREEFKCLATTSPDGLTISKPWQEHWPFVFPEWSELHQCYVEKRLYSLCQALLVQADDRAVRRLNKKASKLTRAQRLKGSPSVPGAWVA